MTSPAAPVEIPTPPWKRVALSYWTAVAIGLALLTLHAWWFAGCRAMPRAEVVSGFGAAMTVLGVFVAARPFIRMGVAGMASSLVYTPGPGFLIDDEGVVLGQMQAAHQARARQLEPDVRAERIVAVLVAAAGTLLNGYGGVVGPRPGAGRRLGGLAGGPRLRGGV